jgi:hypothetical protein
MENGRAEKRAELLSKIGHKLRDDEKTNFNLDRWLDSFDEAKIINY